MRPSSSAEMCGQYGPKEQLNPLPVYTAVCENYLKIDLKIDLKLNVSLSLGTFTA